MMKRAEISSTMLVFIVIAIIAMTVFVIFFTGKSAGLFGQFGRIEPNTADDACQIACNQAKVSHNCATWCFKMYGEGPDRCYEKLTCDNLKDANNEKCDKKYCDDLLKIASKVR